MTTSRRTAGLLVAALLAAGCVERKERLTIDPDGTVTMLLSFETDSTDELYAGDAVPSVEGGWLVSETVTRDEEGTERFRLEAEAVFAPDEDLPSEYATPRDPEPGTSLSFPTSVTFDDREDASYVHFTRTYAPRPWAYAEAARTIVREGIEQFEGRDLEDLTDQERAVVVRMLARAEATKYGAFARLAFVEALPEAPQDLWLAVDAALRRATGELDLDRIVAVLAEEDEAEREKALAEEVEGFEAACLVEMQRTLRARPEVDEGMVNAFVRRFRWQKRYYDITEDLGDDRFEVSVRMPGVVVGHNADEADGNRLTWKFSGELVRDRSVELMATSRVAW